MTLCCGIQLVSVLDVSDIVMNCVFISNIFLKALKKGSSPIFNGIIIGAGPLGVMIFSPITGYLVS